MSEQFVNDLPPRVAHAVHALLATGREEGYGPFTAAEVCVYDASEAFSPKHTGVALSHARRLGLALFIPPRFWTPSDLALDNRDAFEDRFLRDEDIPW